MPFEPFTDITCELQQQINRTAADGGGEVIVPAGEYTFRPIELKSGITLTLAAGCRLIASPHREDYRPIGYHHNEMGEVHSALYAMEQRGIVLRGEGELDLSGTAFYRMDEPHVPPTAGAAITPAHRDECTRLYDWRVNQPIFFHRCTDLRIEGLRVINSPCWTFSFNRCERIKVLNLTILNPLVIPNSDGLHFTCSRDIIIHGCHITAGDDCVALTAIADWNIPCENAVISDCIFQSASKAISVGYMHSIVRHVVINNVIVRKSNRAFVIMSHPGTGLVEHVSISNCIFEGRAYGGNWWGNGEPAVLMATPHHLADYRDPLPEKRFETAIRDVRFNQITFIGERPVAVVAEGPAVENVRISNSTVRIVPEELPSLKGHVIDLAPGPENLTVKTAGCGLVTRGAVVQLNGVTDASGGALVTESH